LSRNISDVWDFTILLEDISIRKHRTGMSVVLPLADKIK